MAVALVYDNTTAPEILRPIEGDTVWSEGPVTYNIVQLSNSAELEAFNRQLPAGTTMTQDLPGYWASDLALALDLINDIVAIDLRLTDAFDATYLIGQERNDESLGAANTPSNPDDVFRPGVFFNTLDEAHTTEGELGGGSDRFQTIVHEYLHSLGLNHPHDTGGSTTLGTGADSVGESMQAPYQWHQTNVSYTSAPGAPGPGEEDAYTYGRGVTAMALDIAALHRMYGANMTARTGDTTYQLTDPQSVALDLNDDDGTIAIGRAYYGIWDAGSSAGDVITYEGDSSVVINLLPATLGAAPDANLTGTLQALRDSGVLDQLSTSLQTELTNEAHQAGGFFSSILDDGLARIPGGFSIANGVVIEEASGGSGMDLLIGNGANNRLIGNGGDDALFGGDGADRLLGGDGDDLIIGGASSADLRDVVFAGAGDDSVDAGAGNDQVFGQDGNDTIAGGAGVDDLQGQNGNDVITGSAFSDLVFGGAGNDFVNGGFGHDRINGGSGADKFFHVGVEGHGSDWVQDYVAGDGDVLLWGGGTATAGDFQVNLAHTANAAGERSGDDGVQEAFVIYKPSEQIIWALVDGGGQSAINIQIGGDTFDLLG